MEGTQNPAAQNQNLLVRITIIRSTCTLGYVPLVFKQQKRINIQRVQEQLTSANDNKATRK